MDGARTVRGPSSSEVERGTGLPPQKVRRKHSAAALDRDLVARSTVVSSGAPVSLIMSGTLKKTVGALGSAVSANPRLQLRLLYEKIQRFANLLPPDYVYRKSVESVVKERCEILQESADVDAVVEKIGQGQIEDLLMLAKNELELVRKIVEERSWEKLMEKAPPNQWTWPPHK